MGKCVWSAFFFFFLSLLPLNQLCQNLSLDLRHSWTSVLLKGLSLTNIDHLIWQLLERNLCTVMLLISYNYIIVVFFTDVHIRLKNNLSVENAS